MNIDELKQKYSAIAGKVITNRRDNFFRLEQNKPVTFFVLLSDYSSRGVWIHPIATHFLGRRYSCSNVLEPNSCYICEQLAILEEELAVMKGESDAKAHPQEAQALAAQVAEFEKRIQSARAQEKYAFNILVKGTEIPQIFEAPKSVAGPIVQVFETVLEEENINIFDPLMATAFTVSKEGENLLTRYKVITAPRPVPILTGEDRDERIAHVIQSGFNLDERYKIPARAELMTAWENYLNGNDQQPQNTPAPAPIARATGPVPMSRIGGRAVLPKTPATPVATAPPPAPAPVTETPEVPAENVVNGAKHEATGNGNNVPEPVATKSPPPPKPDSDLVKSNLLGRLKAASVKK